MKLHTQLNFGGNCEAAFRFYEKHLGGRITMMMKKDQLSTQFKAKDSSENDVLHACMSIGGIELIANDVPKSRFQPIRSSYLYLALNSPEEVERIWAVLARDAQIGMAIGETFFASRFGQLLRQIRNTLDDHPRASRRTGRRLRGSGNEASSFAWHGFSGVLSTSTFLPPHDSSERVAS